MRAHFTTYRLVLSVTHTAQTANSKGPVGIRVGMGMEEGTVGVYGCDVLMDLVCMPEFC